MFTDINSEDRLVQATFADHLRDAHGWDSLYAWNEETFGPAGTLGRDSEREVVLKRDLREAVATLNPDLPREAVEEVVARITRYDASRSTLQHNREFYGWIRDGVPVTYRDDQGRRQDRQAKIIDFRRPERNRFLAVRELKIQGLRTPHYNRRADLVCFVNGLPLVFFELKAVYKNIRAGFDGNLTDYKDTIPHAFYHNAFLVVSNGDNARYGTITSQWEHFSEWKRSDEREKGQISAQGLLDGMLDKARLLDLVESFIAFDESKPGATRKVLARNHQVLGVNRAVASVLKQEDLKRRYPPEKRLVFEEPSRLIAEEPALSFARRAHPDLGRLGVFWHTQGSGKSYSMMFFAEKVRRTVPGNFTFVIMTDREDLDDQIYRTFVGCGAADEKTPRAGTGEELKALLQENHRYVFSLIHKFNQDVTPESPYSRRDDIIVISDEAHRTQAGKLARNMRLALPNASFIGFTGTPLFKNDELTRRIFGDYVSRYDFKRSEEDGATVKLIYENRGEKLGIARLDLNDRIRQKIDAANLDLDEEALLERLLGQDYEVITADDRLDKVADDLVEHCSTRWEAGKSMVVCIDKITCARMLQRILPRWEARARAVAEAASHKEAELQEARDPELIERLAKEHEALARQAQWMRETLIEIIISEGQNEVRDFAKWGFDIVPHRDLMKRGFETPDGRRVDVESAFKDPNHPFRLAIVCAMWLTGFDVECLSTLYIDKPMKAHTLMQAIARANRVYPGKACGVIVDYNGMLKALQDALAQYALGDDAEGPEEIVAPIEELVESLREAIEAAEDHLRSLNFEPSRLVGARGFARIGALRDAVEALYTSDEAKRRFEIMARETFSRFKALLMEPAAFTFAERHDNIEAIYKKLSERRDTADVTEVLREIHKIVNEAIRAQQPGEDQAEGLTVDLSQVNFEKLRDEFAKRITRKRSALQDICSVVEAKLASMLSRNPHRMDYYKRYQEIVGEYNREKDRATVEETFAKLVALANSLDEEQQRAAREGLTEEELALFDLLGKERISKDDRERVKQSSKALLAALQGRLRQLNQWTDREQTKAEVKVFVLNHVYQALPIPPYTERQVQEAADGIYDFVWQQSVGRPMAGETA
jgi:type I restriction enzyme R subunit